MEKELLDKAIESLEDLREFYRKEPWSGEGISRSETIFSWLTWLKDWRENA